jgi:hypothetical protein
MAQLKFERVLGTPWPFELTWKDRRQARQTIAAATGKVAKWRTLDSDTVVLADATGFTVDETSDPATYGDFTYKLSTALQTSAGFVKGTYRLRFEATMNGDAVPCPEDGYVIVEVLA